MLIAYALREEVLCQAAPWYFWTGVLTTASLSPMFSKILILVILSVSTSAPSVCQLARSEIYSEDISAYACGVRESRWSDLLR